MALLYNYGHETICRHSANSLLVCECAVAEMAEGTPALVEPQVQAGLLLGQQQVVEGNAKMEGVD
jgi:hypothetical protein